MELQYIDKDVNLSQKIKMINEMIKDSLLIIYNGFSTGRMRFHKQTEQKTKEIREILEQYQTSTDSFGNEEASLFVALLNHYQKIVFSMSRLSFLTMNKNMEGVLFTEKAVMELDVLFEGVKKLIANLYDVIITGNEVLADYIFNERERYRQLSRKFAQEHEERLIEGICQAYSSSLYLSFLDSFEDIFGHIQAIVQELKIENKN